MLINTGNEFRYKTEGVCFESDLNYKLLAFPTRVIIFCFVH